jgi:hypothetical protein
MPRCPHCDLVLTGDEVATGKCPSCEGRVAGLPTERGGTDRPRVLSGPAPRRGLHVHWGGFVGALLGLLAGLNFLCYALLSEGPHSPSTSTSARVRAFEDLFGVRGTEVLAGLVFLGVAVFFTYQCLKNATAAGKWVVGGILGSCSVAILAVWITAAALSANETAWQHQIANDLKSLPFGVPVEEKPVEVPIRNKVLVWDCTSSTRSKTQELLPAERCPYKGDADFTVVLILKTTDKQTETYEAGEAGFTRTLTLGVVDYPEKKVQGCYLLAGESPGLIVFREPGEKGPIVGNTTGPLKNWIESKGASRYSK